MDPYKHSSSSSADIVYYDLQIANLKSEKLDDNFQFLKFNETRQTPIVEHANQYYMSIVRFSVDTFHLPVYYGEIIPNQNDPNKMIQSFTLVFTDKNGIIYTSRKYVTWSPSDFTKPQPPPPSSNDNGLQTYSPYYFCNSYTHLLELLNQTLKECCDDIFGQSSANIVKTNYPFFGWNVGSNTMSFYGDSRIYNQDNTNIPDGKMQVYFNTNTFTLLNGFPVHKYGINNPDGKHYELILNPFNGLNILAGNGGSPYASQPALKLNQEYSSIYQWSPVAAIVFATSTLPVTPNQLSAPYIYEDGQLVQYSSMTNQTLNIITDLVTDEQSYKPSILYYPTAQFRYISLYNPSPITQIDLQVYWRDKLGNHHPLYLPSGGSCSMKIQFIRKTAI